MIKTLLTFEGLAIFFACLYFYHQLDTSWLVFVLLWLLPDISMVGYLRNNRVGAFAYNLAHNYIPGLLLIFVGMLQGHTVVVSLGIIFISHVGLDRFLGYGLKYPSGFRDTHIQKL